MADDETFLSTEEACLALGVSAATLRNWVRHGYLSAHRQGRRLAFVRAAIETLQEGLQRGSIDRLQRRANKRWSKVGQRVRNGVFYTPAAVADRIAAGTLEHLPPAPGLRILDPACGDGVFLVAALKRLQALGIPIQDDTLIGYDTDPIAVQTTRQRLMAALPEQPDYQPRIETADFLAEALTGRIPRVDVIIGNPPWGADLPKDLAKALARQWPASTGGETFSAFLATSLAHLRPDGRLAFVLPESLLTVKRHALIRQYLATAFQIRRLEPLDRAFDDVFTPALWLEMANTPPHPADQIQIRGAAPHTIEQARFAHNPDYRFDWWLQDADAALLRRLEEHPHQTLAGHADWALGIVTGDNARHLLDTAEPHSEPIIDGTCVLPFRLGRPRRFICFQPERYQQVAPTKRYRAREKLIYRFVSDRLVVAYDDAGHLTLNSANCLIPHLPDWPLAALAVLLNGTALQALHYNRHQAIKVLRSHLEALPIPAWSTATIQRIATATEPLLTGHLSPQAADTQWRALDDWLLALWGFTPSEAERLRRLTSH